MQEFLDDENLVMLVVNQHHNTSHPKVNNMHIAHNLGRLLQ